MITAAFFTSSSITRSYVSRFVWCVCVPYSMGSCWKPIPGKPALLNDVLSVPPRFRPLPAVAP
jgi:hypothetical protein